MRAEGKGTSITVILSEAKDDAFLYPHGNHEWSRGESWIR